MKFKDLRIGMIVKSTSDLDRYLPKVGVVVDIAYEYSMDTIVGTAARGDTDLSKIRVLPVVKFLSDPSVPHKVAIENIEIYQGVDK